MNIGPRRIATHLAPVVEFLERERASLVTLAFLVEGLGHSRHAENPRLVAEQLQRAGWLLPLRTRGAWEFAPAARAGAISGGDRHIELRATLQRRALDVALAHDSAAWAHGLVARPPQREVLAIPERLKMPAALDAYRIVCEGSVLSKERIDDLPVWRIETLLVKMAMIPSSFAAWSEVTGWLGEAFERAEEVAVRRELSAASVQAWVRLAYMAECAGKRAFADELLRGVSVAGKPAGPIYFGRAHGYRNFIAKYNLVDTCLLPGEST